MQVSVYLERTKEQKTITLTSKAKVKDLLTHLGLNPVVVLVTRDNKVLIEDQELKDKDSVKILSVVSGG